MSNHSGLYWWVRWWRWRECQLELKDIGITTTNIPSLVFHRHWIPFLSFFRQTVRVSKHWRQLLWFCVTWAWEDFAGHLCSASTSLLPNDPAELCHYATSACAPCGLWGCKNWPAPFPGRMSYKATKPRLVSVLYLSMNYNGIVVY